MTNDPTYSRSEIDELRDMLHEAREALRITATNIQSLGPAQGCEPYAPYRPWLEMVERVLSGGKAVERQ